MAKKIFGKRALALVLALVMCFSTLQLTAFAAPGDWGRPGSSAYTFTLSNDGSSESWTYDNGSHANWFRYIRFIRGYTVNVFYQNETGSVSYNGETFAVADPVTGSFYFLYPDGGIIDDSEFEDGEYTEPTTLLPADYLPQTMIDQGYEIKYATDAKGKNVLTSGVTISLLGENVLNVYCTLIPPKTGDPMLLYAGLTALSGAGLAWLSFGKKKDEEDEE